MADALRHACQYVTRMWNMHSRREFLEQRVWTYGTGGLKCWTDKEILKGYVPYVHAFCNMCLVLLHLQWGDNLQGRPIHQDILGWKGGCVFLHLDCSQIVCLQRSLNTCVFGPFSLPTLTLQSRDFRNLPAVTPNLLTHDQLSLTLGSICTFSCWPLSKCQFLF